MRAAYLLGRRLLKTARHHCALPLCHPFPAGACTVLGTLPMLWLVNADVSAMPALTVLFAFLSGAMSGTVGPNMRCGGRGGALGVGRGGAGSAVAVLTL